MPRGKRAKDKCYVDGCDNDGGKLGLCTGCRGVWKYWGKRGPKALLEYRDRLEFRQGRMSTMQPDIASLRRKLGAQKAAVARKRNRSKLRIVSK